MLNHVEIPINSPTYGVRMCKLDIGDESFALKYAWQGFCVQSTNTKREGRNPTLYPCVRRYEGGKTKVVAVHRALGIYVPQGHVIDHVNGDTFDNRKCNLEVVTRAENTRRAQNRRKANANNT